LDNEPTADDGLATRYALKGATAVDRQFANFRNAATFIFTVQLHWVTESGDLLFFDHAKSTVELSAVRNPLATAL
jgi:hypothetical protein